MVEFGTSSASRGWVRVRVLGYGFGVRARKVESRDSTLASDLVRALQTIAVLPWPLELLGLSFKLVSWGYLELGMCLNYLD